MSLLYFNLSDSPLNPFHSGFQLSKTRYHKTSVQGETYPKFPLSLTWTVSILFLISAFPFKQSFGRNKNFPNVFFFFFFHLTTSQLYLTANFRSRTHFLKLWNHLFFYSGGWGVCGGGGGWILKRSNNNILGLANDKYFRAPRKVRQSCATLQTTITA